MKSMLTILSLAFLASPLHAVEEESLAAMYDSQIAPYVAENSVVGETRATDGATLKWLKTTNGDENRILLLLGGHSESFVKYAELLYDLRDMRLTVFALDQRGQGYSSRMLPDREKDHIENYRQYIADLRQFMDEVIRPNHDAMIVLMGHSLGGAVAAAYAEAFPDQLSGLILSSPYLGSKAGPLAMFVVQMLDFFGLGKEYAPGGGPFRIVAFEKNRETHSKARHERKMQDYVDAPIIRLGYPTNHWLVEVEKLGRDVLKDAKRIASPTLVLQAEIDQYADTATQNAFCAEVSNSEKVFLQGAFHEILIEKDEIRNVAMTKVRSFIEKHLQ